MPNPQTNNDDGDEWEKVPTSAAISSPHANDEWGKVEPSAGIAGVPESGLPGVPNAIPNIIPNEEAFRQDPKLRNVQLPMHGSEQMQPAEAAENERQYDEGGQLLSAAMAPGALKTGIGVIRNPKTIIPVGKAILRGTAGSIAGADIGAGTGHRLGGLFGSTPEERAKNSEDFGKLGAGIGGIGLGIAGARGAQLPAGRYGLLGSILGEAPAEAAYVPAAKSPGPYRGPSSVPKLEPPLGSPENPGLMSKIPTRMPKPAVQSLSESPYANQNAERAAAELEVRKSAAVPQLSVPRETAPVPGEGRPATWTNEKVKELAQWGDPDAMEQARLRGFGRLPLRFSTTSINPRSVTHFGPEGPIPEGAERPTRLGNVGEETGEVESKSVAKKKTEEKHSKD